LIYIDSFFSLNTKTQFLEQEVQIVAVYSMLYCVRGAGTE